MNGLPMQIALRYFDKPFDGNPETLAEAIKAGIDSTFREVREVLEGLQTFEMIGGEETERHWCMPEGDCNVHCEQARGLMERLAFPQSVASATESKEYVTLLESEAAKNATRRCANCQAAIRPAHCCVCEGCDGCREISANS